MYKPLVFSLVTQPIFPCGFVNILSPQHIPRLIFNIKYKIQSYNEREHEM